ncbi:alkaline phosphatase family protein [Halomicroarcula sp. GCM10025324]|uniref:alkaline phosphatase family protein n=1 Tax=Haloarcula TaxID=2237 RepID=UPI0023E7E0F4|nr:alkaline phosphatase family protein [Halomicroarcula sp. ZS-22-S1]
MDTLILGLDGLEPTLVEQWRGDLPTLDRLMGSGSYGRLRSSDPPLSSPAWQWMFTGKQGGKHGCFGFTRRKENSYERVPLNLTDVHAETLWEALDTAGVACGVVNVPETYPPTELDNGFMISGWPIPNRTNPAAPSDVLTELEAELGTTYKVKPTSMGPELKQFSNQKVFEEMKSAIRHRKRAFETLLSMYDLDVFFGVFTATDIAGHYLVEDEARLRKTYIEQDEALGGLLEQVPDETNIILMSDHGHGAKGTRSFHVVEWLRKEGYLALDSDSDIDLSRRLLRKGGFTRENLLRMKNRLGVGDVRELLPQPVFDVAKRTVPAADEREQKVLSEQIRWDQTTAYVGSEQNVIFLNTEDVHPNGTVPPDRVPELRDELKTKLESLRHPDRDEPLVTELKTREEVFSGPYEAEAPEIVFIMDEMRCKVHTGLNGGELFSDNGIGEHRQDGILITTGPSFAERDEVRRRSILDVFPLALSLSDVALPENVDGEVPMERLDVPLEPSFRESRDEAGEVDTYSAADSDEIKEQLRGLGYLD